MKDSSPTESRSVVFIWLQVAGGSALACCLAFWFMEISGRRITPLWPAAGVATACFQVFGKRALAPAVIGHMSIWLFINPTAAWPVLLIPLLYPADAWLVAGLGGLAAKKSRFGGRDAMQMVMWRLVVAPILGSFPLALLMALLFTWSGRFPPNAQWMTFFLLIMAHLHGIVAFGPLTLHLLRRDFNLPEIRSNLVGIVAGVAGLVMMAQAFRGAFAPWISQGAAIYLPFPLLVMAAARLSPAPVSLLIAVWCVTSTVLNCLGAGPFVVAPAIAGWSMDAAELGTYNMLMGSMAYLVSIGATGLQRQLNLSEVAMNAAGIAVWEWDRTNGLSWIESERTDHFREILTSRPTEVDLLARLAGLETNHEAVPETWRHRLHMLPAEPGKLSGGDVECVGRVLSRSKDGRPMQAIGLLQNPSDMLKTTDALAALGHQKARLRSLQANLNPHFLFNSLNVIRALVHVDPSRADQAVTSLASLLRANLRTTEVQLIPLGEEVEQIRALLRLARLRFGERLSTRVRIPNDLMGTPVPPMLLLNLVENAITHGIGNVTTGGIIALQAREEDAYIHISIRNSGTLSADVVRGIGTRDAHQRLELLYTGKARFRLVQLDAVTVSADVILPSSPKHQDAKIAIPYLPHRR
jgi:hypothetical protein